MRVKSPPKPPSPQPRPPLKEAGTLSALVVTCTLASGCPGPATTSQVRPTPLPAAPCPEGSQQAMKELGLVEGKRSAIYFPGFKDVRQDVPVRSGPGVTLLLRTDEWGKLAKGTTFSGELFVGRERVYGRFTQAHTPQGITYPVCLELYDTTRDDEWGVRREPGYAEDTAHISAGPGLEPVRKFQPVGEGE